MGMGNFFFWGGGAEHEAIHCKVQRLGGTAVWTLRTCCWLLALVCSWSCAANARRRRVHFPPRRVAMRPVSKLLCFAVVLLYFNDWRSTEEDSCVTWLPLFAAAVSTPPLFHNDSCSWQKIHQFIRISNKKHLKNVGSIRHCKPPHAHSADVASGTVARRLRIDVHDDDDDDDNAWQRGPLWPHMEWAQQHRTLRDMVWTAAAI